MRGKALLWSVAGAAAAILVAFAISYGTHTLTLLTWRDAAQFGVATVLLVLVRLFPICLGYKIRATLDGVIVFAAVLLFDPFTAMAITIMGVATHQLVQVAREKWPASFVLFNVAQSGVSTAAASLALRFLPLAGPAVFASGPGLDAVALAAAAYFITNTLLVAAMSSSLLGQRTLGFWWAIYRTGWIRYFAVLSIDVLVAVLYVHAPFALLLMPLPVFAVHQSFSSAISLRDQSRRTLEALADVIDRRDPYTFAHSQRVSECAQLIAKQLGLSAPQQEAIVLAARVHDLGKIGVREAVLRKPGRLTPEELEEIHRHTQIGAEVVSGLGDYSKMREAIVYHHERWDGLGPYRLAHDHIPLSARIIAVADAYDAMTSDRPYRPALPSEMARAELENGKGRQFDPVVVDAFINVLAVQEVDQPASAAVPRREPSFDRFPPLGRSPSPWAPGRTPRTG